jgi:RNA polymerase sigma factor (sigma-70 family)
MEPVEGAAPEEARSDAELIAAVRAGDQGAYATLWARHEAAARRLARQLARPADADELVSESFYRVLRAINGGGGPDGAFRPYLLSTLRRVNIDTGRTYHQRVNLTEDESDLEREPVESAADAALRHDENSAVWRAWASLPESSRTLLWHLLIEEETPAQIAPLLGTTPNGVSSRAVRAKERLRQAFLQQHVQSAGSQQCEWTRRRLGEYVRKALAERSEATVEAHLKSCERCKTAALYLTDVNQALRVAVAPVVLGGALIGAKYLASGGAGHFGWVAAMRPRGKVARASTAGAAAAAVLAAALVAVALTGNDEDRPQHDARQVAVTPDSPQPARAAARPPAASPTRARTTTPHRTPPPARGSSRPVPAPPTPRTHRPPPSSSSRARPPRPRKKSTSPRSTRPRTTPRPTPTTSRPKPSPTTSLSPVPRTRTMTLSAGHRFIAGFLTTDWTIISVAGPSGAACAPATGRYVSCDVPGAGPSEFTVTATGSGAGYLWSNGAPYIVEF